MDNAHINAVVPPSPIQTRPSAPSYDNLTRRVTDFLLGRVSLDELCQFCVLDLLVPLAAWQMSIYTMGSDTLLRLRGTFGRVADRGNLHEYSCLSDIKLGERLRHGTPLANFPIDNTGRNSELTLTELGDGPQALWPLTTSHSLVGVVQLRFNEVPDVSLLTHLLSQIAPPISLTLDLCDHPSTLTTTNSNGAGINGAHPMGNGVGFTKAPVLRNQADGTVGHGPLNDDAPAAITQRQRRVLELMAQGMTNGQIARALAFSESTIRQETMAIYRALDVSGRVDAVKVAGEQGLIPTRS
jgi:DNA-binding CsgD family transcriptional regulator